jgi:alpha-mannosidase
LAQSEALRAAEPNLVPDDTEQQLTEAWKRVAFNQFHDTLGGTCLPSAYAQPLAQLGYAQNVADDLLHMTVRRKMNALPDDPRQRIVLYNASDRAYDGPVEFTPWLDWKEWQPSWRLVDDNGANVPFQTMLPEQLLGKSPNLLFPIAVGPAEWRVLAIEETGGESLASLASATHERLSTTAGLILDRSHIRFPNGIVLPLPELVLIEDATDTWSHDIDRYSGEVVGTAVWQKAACVDKGPLMASFVQEGQIGQSTLNAEWRVYADGFAELRLTVDWHERHKLLKLVQALPDAPTRRIDGILGGWLERPLTGRETPIRDGVLLETPTGKLGFATPDVYAVDGTPERLRFTLLRSAIMAHHNPHNGFAPRRTFSDHGENKFLFRFFAGDAVTTELLDTHATQIQRPLIAADLTRGMPTRRMDIE